MNTYSRLYATGLIFALFCLFPGILVAGVSAADASYEGNLGDTIDLYGVSYSGTSVYLFLTGPNLPANGVTLTDVNERADQGHFTIVDLDNTQHWSMKWNTARIENEIDPGTYTVYVVTEPVDKSQLSGNNYQTLSVYLKDAGVAQGSAGTSYALNPEKHISTIAPTTIPPTLPPVVPAQEPVTVVTSQSVTFPPTPPVTRAAGMSLTAILAWVGLFGFVILNKKR